MTRCLIVNADDFGRCHLINAGVLRAHAEGIVTSASLMVRWPAAADAVAAASEHPRLALGLHLDLGEWTYGDGSWPAVYEVVDLEDGAAVEVEVRAQLEAFRALAGRDPTHIDSHQHVHLRGHVASAAERLAAELGVPLRHRDAGIRYCGDFYGQDQHGLPMHDAITAERLVRIIRELPPGVTELACHPGDGSMGSTYAVERRLEVLALCDTAVRTAVSDAGVALRGFGRTKNG